MLPTCRPHFVEFVRTTNKDEQAWCRLIPSHLLSKVVLIPGGAGHQSHYSGWAMGWTTEKSLPLIPTRGRYLSLLQKASRPARPLFTGYRGQLLGVKGPGLEADHSSLSGTEVKNKRSYTFTHTPTRRHIHSWRTQGRGDFIFWLYTRTKPYPHCCPHWRMVWSSILIWIFSVFLLFR